MQISDILGAEQRKKLMYDDHNLSRSEMYFTADQLLRIFPEWVNELGPDLGCESLHEQISSQIVAAGLSLEANEPQAYRVLEDNWKLLLRHAEASRKDILKLVERKRDEIQSLRDGVS